MTRPRPLLCLIALAAAPAPGIAAGANFTFTAYAPAGVTINHAYLNDKDQIAGGATFAGGNSGFKWQNGKFTQLSSGPLESLNDAGLAVTQASVHDFGILNINTGAATMFRVAGLHFLQCGLDNRGNLCGTAVDRAKTFALIRSVTGGEQRINPPGSSGSDAYAINDSGKVVGSYLIGGETSYLGYAYKDGKLEVISPNGDSGVSPTFITRDGVIGGSLSTGGGFVLRGSKYTVFTYPMSSTLPVGVGPGGEVVGVFLPPGGNDGSFIYKNGAFYEFNYPGASQTIVTGINERGRIIGYTFDNNVVGTFFIAQCPASQFCTQ